MPPYVLLAGAEMNLRPQKARQLWHVLFGHGPLMVHPKLPMYTHSAPNTELLGDGAPFLWLLSWYSLCPCGLILWRFAASESISEQARPLYPRLWARLEREERRRAAECLIAQVDRVAATDLESVYYNWPFPLSGRRRTPLDTLTS